MDIGGYCQYLTEYKCTVKQLQFEKKEGFGYTCKFVGVIWKHQSKIECTHHTCFF